MGQLSKASCQMKVNLIDIKSYVKKTFLIGFQK